MIEKFQGDGSNGRLSKGTVLPFSLKWDGPLCFEWAKQGVGKGESRARSAWTDQQAETGVSRFLGP